MDLKLKLKLKLGVTGSRTGLTAYQKDQFAEFMKRHQITELHHGDCVGVDKYCHDYIVEHYPTIKVVIHPPTDSSNRAWCKSSNSYQCKPYLQRNQDIVNKVNYLIAFPNTKTEQLRSGTWATIRYARKKQLPLVIVGPT